MSLDQRSSAGQPLPVFILRGLPTASSSVTSLCFLTHENKDCLLCGTDCGQLLLWSLDSFRCQTVLKNSNDSRVQHLIAFDDSFLCQYQNGWIDVFDRLSVDKSLPISDTSYCKCSLYSDTDFSDNSSLVINPKILGFVSKTNLIELIDFRSEESLLSVGVSDRKYGWPFALHISPQDMVKTEKNKIFVIIGYENGFITVFSSDLNANESQFLTELKCFESVITAMDFNRLKMTGICCSVDNVVSVWTLNAEEDGTDVSLSLKRDLKLGNSGLLCCAIRSDARIFGCGGSDHRIGLLALRSLKPLAVMDTHSDAIECLVFSNKLKSKQMQYYLAVGSKDKTISIWNLYNNLSAS